MLLFQHPASKKRRAKREKQGACRLRRTDGRLFFIPFSGDLNSIASRFGRPLLGQGDLLSAGVADLKGRCAVGLEELVLIRDDDPLLKLIPISYEQNAKSPVIARDSGHKLSLESLQNCRKRSLFLVKWTCEKTPPERGWPLSTDRKSFRM